MIYFLNIFQDEVEKHGSEKSAAYQLAKSIRQAWDNDYSVDYVHSIKVVNNVPRIIHLTPFAEHLAGYMPSGGNDWEIDWDRAINDWKQINGIHDAVYEGDEE